MSTVARVLTRSAWCLLIAGCGAPLLECNQSVSTPKLITRYMRPCLQVRVSEPTLPNTWVHLDELAFEDGDLPWRPVALQGGRATLEVTDPEGRYGLAFTARSRWKDQPVGVRTSIFRQTLDEDPEFDWGSETSPSPEVAPNLTIGGLQPNQPVTVGFGAERKYAEAYGATASFSLTPGVSDLVVMLLGKFAEPDRVIIRRNEPVGRGMTTVDFTEAVELANRPFRISGALDANVVSVETFFQPANSQANGSPLVLGQWSGPATEAHLEVLPEGLALPGDSYAFQLSTGGLGGHRFVKAPAEALTASAGVEFPPPLEASMQWGRDGHPIWQWSPRPGSAHFASTSLQKTAQITVSIAASEGWLGSRSELSIGATAAAPLLDAHSRFGDASGYWGIYLGADRSGATCSRPEVDCRLMAFGRVEAP